MNAEHFANYAHSMNRSRRSLGVDTSAAADIEAARLVADVTKAATAHATGRDAAAAATPTQVAVRLQGKWYTAHVADVRTLEAAGVSFALVGVHDGRLCTVPVN